MKKILMLSFALLIMCFTACAQEKTEDVAEKRKKEEIERFKRYLESRIKYSFKYGNLGKVKEELDILEAKKEVLGKYYQEVKKEYESIVSKIKEKLNIAYSTMKTDKPSAAVMLSDLLKKYKGIPELEEAYLQLKELRKEKEIVKHIMEVERDRRAQKALAAVKETLAQKQYFAAYKDAQKLIEYYRGNKVEQEAEKIIADLNNNPESKKVIEKGLLKEQDEEIAMKIFNVAELYIKFERIDDAKILMNDIIRKHPNTKAAEKAATYLKSLQK